MDSSEEQEIVVVVQIEEPTSPNTEQTEGDQLDDHKFTDIIEEEEDGNQNDKTNQLEQNSVAKSTEGHEKTGIEKSTYNNAEIHLPGSSKTRTTNNEKDVLNETVHKRLPQIGVVENDQDSPSMNKRRKVELFTDLPGPEWYNVRGNLVTRSILAKNLPKIYESLPIYGRPENNRDFEKFYNDKLREFIGLFINDDEFEELSKYCSPEHLKTGQELSVNATLPTPGMLSVVEESTVNETKANLCILKKCKMRMEKDRANNYSTKLKYRGVRLIPWTPDDDNQELTEESDAILEPGKDILYRIRIYRPYTYNITKDRSTRGRHSVFNCDMVMVGALPLEALRDRIVCTNDADMRLDIAHAPHTPAHTCAKEVFPSGFLFINNTFYVDYRPRCKDLSRVVRAWAAERGMGQFPVRDMAAVTLDDVVVRLGYPEVYVHQGSCEHVFTFSELRLAGARDPARRAQYPRPAAVAQLQTVYCTTCAEFGARWVVVGCARVPFDPAFFCDTCFRHYLYVDGAMLGHFKAYAYRGNETNTLKPS